MARQRHLPCRFLRDRIPGGQPGLIVAVGLLHQRHALLQRLAGIAAPAAVRSELLGLEIGIERIDHARLVGRQISQLGARAVGHREPVMRAARAGIDQDRIEAVMRRRIRGDLAALVDRRPIDLHDRLGRDELPGRGIEDIEIAVLRRLHDHMALPARNREVGGDDRAGAGIIPVLPRNHLIMPGILAGLRMQRDDRADEEVIALAFAAIMPRQRRSVAGAEIDEVGLGIVGDRIPWIGAAAELPPWTRPCPGGHRHHRIRRLMIRPLRRIAGRGVEFPQLPAGIGIIGRSEAANAEIAAAIADHDHPGEYARGAGDGVRRSLAIEGDGGPDRLAGGGIERDQPPIEGGDDRLALPQSEAARDGLAAGIAPHFARHLRIVGPEPLAGAGVISGGDVPCADIVEHAIGIKRRALDSAIGVQFVIPSEAELIDIARIDAGQRAVALRGVGPPVAQPAIRLVGGIGQPGRIDIGLGLRQRAIRQGEGRYGSDTSPRHS